MTGHKCPPPVVYRSGGGVYVEISRRYADELLVHLQSHNVGVTDESDLTSETAWLRIRDHDADDITALLEEWEVVKV